MGDLMRKAARSVTAATLLVVAATSCGQAASKNDTGPAVILTFKILRAQEAPKATRLVADEMRARLAELGEGGEVSRDEQAHTVSVRIDGSHLDPHVSELLAAQARLEMFDLEPALLPPSIDAHGQPVAFRSRAAIRRRVPGGRLPRLSLVVTCSRGTANLCPGEAAGLPPRGTSDYYLFKDGSFSNDRYGPFPNMTGADLELLGSRQSVDSTGAPIVVITFNDAGNRKFQQVTRAEAIRGKVAGTQQHFAVVVDGKLRTWPAIDYRQFPNGIDPTGRGAEIAALTSLAEARKLAVVLKAASLGRVVLISQRRIAAG